MGRGACVRPFEAALPLLLIMIMMVMALAERISGFAPPSFYASKAAFHPHSHTLAVGEQSTDGELTPELKTLVESFSTLSDDKIRYQQLLFMGQQAPAMSDELKTPENKVPGCLSTVHVHATFSDGKVYFQGDSDGLLTKGLVLFLVKGLSGNTPEDIQKVPPEFIRTAGIAASLTPGRNSGFLNMLRVMKAKAWEFASDNRQATMHDSMMAKLQLLKPVKLELVDVSDQHAGHAGARGIGGESHFELEIVAECFRGMSLVQRHKLIYTVLSKEMGAIHALSIKARTPEEAS